jgi:hypothetical protein
MSEATSNGKDVNCLSGGEIHVDASSARATPTMSHIAIILAAALTILTLWFSSVWLMTWQHVS